MIGIYFGNEVLIICISNLYRREDNLEELINLFM